MTVEPFVFVLILSCFVVLVILAIGILGFARGGQFNRRHGNRLMRYRIFAQATAVLVIVGFVWLRSKG